MLPYRTAAPRSEKVSIQLPKKYVGLPNTRLPLENESKPGMSLSGVLNNPVYREVVGDVFPIHLDKRALCVNHFTVIARVRKVPRADIRSVSSTCKRKPRTNNSINPGQGIDSWGPNTNLSHIKFNLEMADKDSFQFGIGS